MRRKTYGAFLRLLRVSAFERCDRCWSTHMRQSGCSTAITRCDRIWPTGARQGLRLRSVSFASGRRGARLRSRAVAATVSRVRIALGGLTFSPLSPGFLYLLTLRRSAPVVTNRAGRAGATRESRCGDGGRSRDQDSGDKFGVHEIPPIDFRRSEEAAEETRTSRRSTVERSVYPYYWNFMLITRIYYSSRDNNLGSVRGRAFQWGAIGPSQTAPVYAVK